MTMRMLAALGAALFLISCGGGGTASTGGPGAPGNRPGTPEPRPSASAAQDATVSSSVSAAGQVADSLPAFGSVSQSASHSGVTQISTDRASTSFNGDDFILRISRARGNDIHLSTADDHAATYELGRTPISGFDTAAEGFIVDYKPAETTAFYGQVHWRNADPSDYLAGGYWLHWTGDILGSNFRADDAGAFVDGPEFSMANRPSIAALQGSATYRGEAAGLYGVDYGSDFPQYADAIGEWAGNFQLSANFGAGTIGGCVACDGSMMVDGEHEAFRIHLGAVPLNSDGTFRGGGVRLEHSSIPTSSASGNWGGMLSNRMAPDGDPRLVAGTLGGEAATAGGTEVVFIGAFYGTK